MYSKFLVNQKVYGVDRKIRRSGSANLKVQHARKSIYHGYMVWREKSVTRDHCSASRGLPNDADQ